jgi:hypothetical protein
LVARSILAEIYLRHACSCQAIEGVATPRQARAIIAAAGVVDGDDDDDDALEPVAVALRYRGPSTLRHNVGSRSDIDG